MMVGIHSCSPKLLQNRFFHRKSLKSIDINMDDYMRRSGHRPAYYGKLEEEVPEDEDGNSEIFVNSRGNEAEMNRYWEDPYFCMDEDEARAADLPMMAKELPGTRKYGTTLGSLDDFTALESLSTGFKLLLGAEEYTPGAEHMEVPPPPFGLINALPPSLTYLYIRGYKKGENELWDNHIAELMTGKAEKLPALQTVVGIGEEIAGGKVVENADENEHLLWNEPPAEEGLWEEWGVV